MIKIDYARIEDKLKELKILEEKFKAEAEEKVKNEKAVVDAHQAELEKLYDYQRKAVDYFEVLESLNTANQNLNEARKANNASLIEGCEKQINGLNQRLSEVDKDLQDKFVIADAAMTPYLNKIALNIGKAYKEWSANPTCKWEEKDEAKKASTLVEIQNLKKTGYKLWPESKSISKMRESAMKYLTEIKYCMNEISYIDFTAYRKLWYDESAEYTNVKAAIKMLENLVITKQQTDTLRYIDPMLPEEEQGNLELESLQPIKDLVIEH